MTTREDRPAGSAERVLVTGVYLADRENRVSEIVVEMGRSRSWQVEQRWCALGRSPVPEHVAAVTVQQTDRGVPKFVLLNRLIAQCLLEHYAYVLVCDDDIALPADFVDRYLELVARHDLALAQPARTHGSYIDHPFVEQLEGLDARRTRFVEIGPLFSIARQAYRHLVPFDETSPMGWGYDFVWPAVIEAAGLRMGIVDATPVVHDLRPPVTFYSFDGAKEGMETLLATHPHLTRAQAFSIVEAYSQEKG